MDTKSSTEQAIWLRGLKRNLKREAFQILQEQGKERDQSDPPIYLCHVKSISSALSKVGSAEASIRKIIINTLYRSVGRSSEVAWLTWDGFEWDPYFQCAFVEVPQQKTSKFKFIPIAAGIDRHCDWFLDLGDFLVLQHNRSIYNPCGAAWIFPDLQTTSQPGKTIGNYIKGMLPKDRGGMERYRHVAVAELPVGANAGMWFNKTNDVIHFICFPRRTRNRYTGT